MQIPFVDLYAQYKTIKKEIDSAISDVIESTAFIRGDFVEEFEKSFADDYGINHCVSVGNGTDALYICLKMLGIGEDDEVITTAHSWISTSETIVQTGATPVFIDVDEYFTIDVNLIEKKITPKTKAIVPVHIYGQPADMHTIMKIAEKYNLFVIEDCAQAHYATFEGQRVGTFGNAGTFSFYPGKNLGAYGDAGAIVTNDDELALKVKMFANHGAVIKHEHKINGINSRMDGLQAAILLAKLPYIHRWTNLRRNIADEYNKMISELNLPIILPSVRDNCEHVFHLYVIKTDARERVMNYLDKSGIQTVIHYPKILPLLDAYSYLNYSPTDFPSAFENQSKILSLPIYPELDIDKRSFIIQNLKTCYKHHIE